MEINKSNDVVVTPNKLEKIASNVEVFVAYYFSKQRPFEVIKGTVVKKPTYPNTIRVGKAPPGSQIFDKSLVVESFQSEGYGKFKELPLFVEGSDFRMGTYYGDIFKVLSPDGIQKHYYLFRVQREPHKTIRIDQRDIITPRLGQNICLQIVSPGNRISKIYMERTGNVNEDMKLISTKVSSLVGTMQNLVDCVSEDLESYVRSYYLKEKIHSIGGTGKKNRRTPHKVYKRGAIIKNSR